LRRWNFPKAVADVTGTPFRLLVSEDDLRYFGEIAESRPGTKGGPANPRATVLAYLVRRRLFGLSSYRINSERDLIRMVESVTSNWRNYAILRLLDNVLSASASEVARVIVQELLANVLEHPAPRLAVIASQLTLRTSDESQAKGELSVSVWDSGTPIVDTLQRRLRLGHAIRVASPDIIDTFVVDPTGCGLRKEQYDTGWTPDADSDAQEILLASLFPGVTSKAATNLSRPSAKPPGRHPTDSGYGLYALYKTAIDTFGGAVEVRSSHLRLQIDRPADFGGKYRVRVRRDVSPRTMGNVITVRLPAADV
jgi:hypothetical protein